MGKLICTVAPPATWEFVFISGREFNENSVPCAKIIVLGQKRLLFSYCVFIHCLFIKASKSKLSKLHLPQLFLARLFV